MQRLIEIEDMQVRHDRLRVGDIGLVRMMRLVATGKGKDDPALRIDLGNAVYAAKGRQQHK